MSASRQDGEARWRALRERIVTLRSMLQDQGTLAPKQRRGRAYWYLRYYEVVDGERKQRSLYVGDEHAARRVEALLRELREPAEYMRETLRLVNIACRLARSLVRRRQLRGTDGGRQPGRPAPANP